MDFGEYGIVTMLLILRKLNNMGGIYKITNRLDSKAYIGKTKNADINAYCERHFKSALDGKLSDRYFYNAIRKYGKDKFKIEILENGNFSNDELSEKEIHYIALYIIQLTTNLVIV